MLIKYSPKVEHVKCVMLTPKEGLTLERSMVTLLPGTNEVTNDEWKAMRGNITAELESDEITILAQKVSAGRGKIGGVKARDLKEMPVNIAVKYVSECMNPDTLTKWYKEITNEEVRLAITKRFKKLELETPEDEIPTEKLENEAPMSLEEFELDEDGETDDDDFEEDSGETDDSDDDNNGDSEEETKTNFSELTVKELKVKCNELGIDYKKFSKKDDFVEALENYSKE